ncbi:MAG: nascent polypeptide-associated complex protein [Candidatus Altiarchaeota archaeon]|nr:nascent polypeptide-associated complex protein [Candidatus Altiarchaeota archaeon]
MFPGNMNPRQMKQMMKRMGIKVDDVEAEMVIIHGPDEEIIIEEPQVTKTVMQGQEIYQIMGGRVRKETIEASVDIDEEDVGMVAQQADVSNKEARAALEEAGGDIAAAIMKLKS